MLLSFQFQQSDDFEDATANFGGGNDDEGGSKRRGQTSRFQQWFKSADEQQQQPQSNQQSSQQDGKISESVLNFMQTAKGSGGVQHHQDTADPNPVPRPPSSTSGTSDIMSVKDLEASMQKKATGQAPQFAQGPKIFGTGRLMNRIPNLMDQQVAALQKEQHPGNQQQQVGMNGMPPNQQPPPPQQQPQQGGSGAGPEDMFAFQNFLAQISKSGAGGGPTQLPGSMGMGMPGKPMAPPPQQQQAQGGHQGARMWGPEEANLLANSAGTPPILKMIMHQQQQQQQFLQENLNRQQQALAAAALVKAAQAQAALRLSPNGK